MNINKSKKFSEFFDVANERKIEFLVLHHIEANSAEHAISQLLEHQVSSHFLIDEPGEIFQLVDEENVAYHAGVSFWAACNGLNKTSIGIEFINSSPFGKNFEEKQMQAGLELCQYLIKKYNIKPRNVVGHSDIAYFAQDCEAGKQDCLDRKQDPSHFFDWQFLAQNGVGIFPKNAVFLSDEILFQRGESNEKIKIIKEKLQQFGYRVKNLNNDFDEEMCALVRVFNRRFNADGFVKNSDVWYLTSQAQLDFLVA